MTSAEADYVPEARFVTCPRLQLVGTGLAITAVHKGLDGALQPLGHFDPSLQV